MKECRPFGSNVRRLLSAPRMIPVVVLPSGVRPYTAKAAHTSLVRPRRQASAKRGKHRLRSHGRPSRPVPAHLRTSHAILVLHASCDRDGSRHGYSSDDENDDAPCPCQWHDAMIEMVSCARSDVEAWPGPWCGVCWAGSCACGYVLDNAHDSSGFDRFGRYRCYACAPDGVA